MRIFNEKQIPLCKYFATYSMKKTPLLVFFLSLFLLCCSDTDRYVAFSGYAQGGTYVVKVNMKGVDKSEKVLQEGIDSILNLIDSTLSGYNKASLLSRFNAGETIVPNELFLDVYTLSRKYYELSEGAFDVASGPLFNLWGFGFSDQNFPEESQIAAVRDSCGMDLLISDLRTALARDGSLSPVEVLLDKSSKLPVLNYNAIAQGLSCDLIAQYLYAAGAKDMLVNIGEIYCDGLNPSRSPWTIGVDRPVDGNNSPGADLSGKWHSDGGPCGIVTSGNYRKFRIVNGHKYAHTIDPRIGRPVEHKLLSATIVAPSGAAADAIATWCMVIGLEESKAKVEELGVEAYLIYDSEGKMESWNSDGFPLTLN